MAKLTLSRIFELSKVLTTTSGRELEAAWTYVSELAEQVLRALRNGVTLKDNLDASLLRITVSHGIEAGFNPRKSPLWVTPGRVISTLYGVDSHRWYVNAAGEWRIVVNFSPVPVDPLEVDLVVFY